MDNQDMNSGVSPAPKTVPQTISPTAPLEIKTGQFDFYEALKQIMAGRNITKLEWGNRNIYGTLKDTHLTLHKTDNRYYDWILNDGDIEGEDYIVVN